MNNINYILEKLNLPEKITYFKKLFWIFISIFIIFNIVIFYFLDKLYYIFTLIIGNTILFWALVPLFIFIGKTYLVDKASEIAKNAKNNLEGKVKEKIVRVIEKDIS